ncbi:YebG family protein [Ferrimonas gelatinilytica]|uniref:Multidrug DMT transporter permease n=1 Tax=Ferrimonas gelatinilytica TaxID=1255257 RepID=A0ABP9S270_9GAMM
MAVIVKYVVERKGEEVMTFSSKAEADAYDKMLDLADDLAQLLEQSGLLSEPQVEEVSLHLAQNKEALAALLKGKRAAKAPTAKEPKAAKEEASSTKAA